MWLRVLPVFLLALLVASSGRAAVHSIFQLRHTAWTVAGGAPAGLQAISQTKDGYLWLGGVSGLYRFDGVRFERFESATGLTLPNLAIAGLWTLKDGGLWIHYTYGGLSHFDGKTVHHFQDQNDILRGTIYAMDQDSAGTIWAASALGLLRLDHGRWRNVGTETGFGDNFCLNVFFDRDGGLWASTTKALMYRKPGDALFQTTRLEANQAGVAQTDDGRIWISNLHQGLHPLAPWGTQDSPVWYGRGGAAGIMRASDGSLWTNYDQAVQRLSFDVAGEPPLAEHFDISNGLSGPHTFGSFEDHEGNIWIATSGGLDRFSPVAFTKVLTPSTGENFGVAPGESGSVWIGDRVDHLLELKGNTVKAHEPSGIGSLYRDVDGTVWVGSVDRLWHSASKGWTSVDLPPVPARDDSRQVQAITGDLSGRLYVSIAREGIRLLEHGVWTILGPDENLPKGAAGIATGDAAGRVWFGYPRNRIALFDGHHAKILGADQGLSVGNVQSILPRPDGVWIGGELGLMHFDGERFSPFLVARDGALSGVTGVVQTGDGDLWLNTAAGVHHIAGSEVTAALTGRGYRAVIETFGSEEGVPGISGGLRPLPTAVEGTDGRIWVSTTDGVAWIDPKHIWRNEVLPPVKITKVSSERTTHSGGEPATFAAGTKAVEIDFTALSLVNPERVQFRYKLDGVDDGWQDSGNRRAAFYTNLGPGEYRFHVVASNNDGRWNLQGDEIAITIPRMFVQTNTFRILCGLLAIAAVLLAMRWRVGQLEGRLRAQLDLKLAERERIARDLHDTLLQGVQGLIYRLQAFADRLTSPENRAELEKALDDAEDLVNAGRDHLQDIRRSVSDPLSNLLSKSATETFRSTNVQSDVSVTGTSDILLKPDVQDELYKIAGEAMRNARNHSGASRVEVELRCAADGLVLHVRDNGRGFDAEALQSQDGGHFGLRGMKERAARISAMLNVSSLIGSGTDVTCSIAAEHAYLEPRLSTLRGRFRRRTR